MAVWKLHKDVVQRWHFVYDFVRVIILAGFEVDALRLPEIAPVKCFFGETYTQGRAAVRLKELPDAGIVAVNKLLFQKLAKVEMADVPKLNLFIFVVPVNDTHQHPLFGAQCGQLFFCQAAAVLALLGVVADGALFVERLCQTHVLVFFCPYVVVDVEAARVPDVARLDVFGMLGAGYNVTNDIQIVYIFCGFKERHVLKLVWQRQNGVVH